MTSWWNVPYPNKKSGGRKIPYFKTRKLIRGTKKKMIRRKNIGFSILMEHQKQIQVEQVWF